MLVAGIESGTFSTEVGHNNAKSGQCYSTSLAISINESTGEIADRKGIAQGLEGLPHQVLLDVCVWSRTLNLNALLHIIN